MSKIAFLGFAPSKVRVRVSQRDSTIEDTIDLSGTTALPKEELTPTPPPPAKDDSPLPAPPSGASLTLSATRTTATAPAGIFFEADASGFGVYDHYLDLDYFWVFDDPGYYTRAGVTDLPWGRVYDVDGTTYIVRGPVTYQADGETTVGTASTKNGSGQYQPGFGSSKTYLGPESNVAYGPRVAHTFASAGTYTVKCIARKRGEGPVTETIEITINDADTVFSGTKTICVSPTSNFSGAPSGSQQVTSWAAAISAASGGGEKRILFHRGETISAGSSRPSGVFDKLMYGAYGSGADPIITSNGFQLRGTADDTGEDCVWGLEIRPSNYVADLPFTTNPGGKKAITKWSDAHSTVYDCKIHQMTTGIEPNLGVQHLVISDVEMTNWHKYGYYANWAVGYIAFCGFFARQNADVITGPGEDETVAPFYADHGPIRIQSTGGPHYVGLADLWSFNARNAPDTYFQPVLRIGRSSYTASGPYVEEANIERMRGFCGPSFGTGNADGSTAKPRRYLWHMSYLLQQNQGDRMLGPSVLGLHFRNLIGIIADVKPSGGTPSRWIGREAPEKSGCSDIALMADFGVDAYNCLFVDMRPGGSMNWDIDVITKGGKLNGGTLLPAHHVKIGNNIVHAPKRFDSTETGDGPFDSRVFWSSTYPGVRFEAATPIDTGYRVPDDHFALFEPAAGSPAIGAASTAHSNVGNGQGSLVAVRDFWGNLRGAKTSKGAFD